jgi:hypothetical protein
VSRLVVLVALTLAAPAGTTAPAAAVDQTTADLKARPAVAPVTVASPDGRIKFELDLRSADRLSYRITKTGRPVIEHSRLGIVVDGVNLGDGATIGAVQRTHQDERYATRGVHAMATNRNNGAAISVTHGRSGTTYTIDVRVFDDGVAFRYVVPGSANVQRTPDEATVFNFPAGSTVWYHDLDGHYEGVYAKTDIEDVKEGDWAAPPLTRAASRGPRIRIGHGGRPGELRRHGAAGRPPWRLCRGARSRGACVLSPIRLRYPGAGRQATRSSSRYHGNDHDTRGGSSWPDQTSTRW